CYSLIAADGLNAFGQRLHSLAAGVLAAVVFLSAPWILSLGEAGLNEGPVAMYAILAIFAVWLTANKNSKGESMSWEKPNTHGSVLSTQYLVLSTQGTQPSVLRFVALAGFLSGSAVSCKYPPALLVDIPLGVWTVLGDWLTGFVNHQI